MVSNIEINESFWFSSSYEKDLLHFKKGLDLFINNFEKASTLQEYPIFLDTNVLLYFYKVSNIVKENFISFLKKNEGNVYITGHVKNEFLKSRVRVINNDYLNVLKEVPNELLKNINKISNFKNSNKTLLNDYGEIFSDLLEVEASLLSVHKRLENKINKDLEKNKNIKYNDPLLEAYSKILVVKNLSKKELHFIRDKFISLNKQSHITYPGMMDFKKKKNNSEGDFIIFHELMKFMKENDTCVTFLTNDNKEDWFEVDRYNKRHPLISYIEITYNNTKHFNYILDANRTLSDLLDIKIQSNTYQKRWEKENKILKDKTFSATWVNDLFKEEIINYQIDQFSCPVSEVDLDYQVELSGLDFEGLIESNESGASFRGTGTAFHTSTDEVDNEINIAIAFEFYGLCQINTEFRKIDFYEFNISELSKEIY